MNYLLFKILNEGGNKESNDLLRIIQSLFLFVNQIQIPFFIYSLGIKQMWYIVPIDPILNFTYY
jgi:hypothetical protein